MKKIIQKKIIKIIQPEVAEYYCDVCGKKIEMPDKKTTYYDGTLKRTAHACLKTCNPLK